MSRGNTFSEKAHGAGEKAKENGTEKMKNKPILTPGAAVTCTASVVGKKEHDGPLGKKFDVFDDTDRFGEKTFELSESEMQRIAMGTLLNKSGLGTEDLDAVFAGDLLNQCVGSSFGLLEYDVSYFGLYGACSTAAESMILSAMLVSAGMMNRCAGVTSSHNASAERQYRNPLEYGGQRSPTAQWTVTGSGAFLIEKTNGQRKKSALIHDVMPGIVVDKGVKDLNNMGAAMAPAALQTLMGYFEVTGKCPKDFDMIVTGDLGSEGMSILGDLMTTAGADPGEKLTDCGVMIYDKRVQDVHSGGSGCGCSAVVMAAHVLPLVCSGELNNILFVGTGAMMSPSSAKQGKPIPAVAHLVHFTSPDLSVDNAECREEKRS